jgi:competence protein ComEC
MLLAAAMFGFADGALSTGMARAPLIREGQGVSQVQGWVVDVASSSAERSRLLIAPEAISGVPAGRLPERIRITLRQPSDARPGDAIAVHAILDPPPGPASPGGYDFARDAWFARLGGVGFALGEPHWTELPRPRLGLGLEMGLNALRWKLTERLAGDLAESQADDLRNSGLAHMLAIAGLHTAAVTGFVFAAIRLAVAAWPWLALRVSGKKLAAAGGLAATLVYLALSGAHPPARRAAITAGVAFIAILCDRRAVSMRSLALAALAILILQPLAVVQPGFQMSFCATAALVAMAELWPRHGRTIQAPWFIAWPQHVRDWAVAMAMVSLVAGLATAPFALQHFNRMATYGLFANFAADLVASLVLMPALVVSAIGEALGLSRAWLGPPLTVADWAASAILAIAHLFANAPGAVKTLPSAPEAALLTAFLGIVFACLWRGWLRWFAAPLAAAVLVWPRPAPPVAWIAADGNNAALAVDGRMVVLKPKVRAFASQAWATRRGLTAPFDPDAEARLAYDCDRSGCLPRPGTEPALGAWWSQRVQPAAGQLDALCRASDILVLRAPVSPPAACDGALVLTPAAFARGGVAEVFARPGGGWRLEWSETSRGRRPWTAFGVAEAENQDAQPRDAASGLSDSGG